MPNTLREDQMLLALAIDRNDHAALKKLSYRRERSLSKMVREILNEELLKARESGELSPKEAAV